LGVGFENCKTAITSSNNDTETFICVQCHDFNNVDDTKPVYPMFNFTANELGYHHIALKKKNIFEFSPAY